MPQPKASRQQPAPARKSPWLGLAAVVLAVCAVAYYLVTRPAPASPGSTSATPAAPAPFVAKHLYSETADPNADIAAALARAKSEHKRVLIDFGGDWCGDCQVLDIYFHQPPNDQLLENNFVLVHVWVGHIDTHLDVPERYGVRVIDLAKREVTGTVDFGKGVRPHCAVVNPRNGLLYVTTELDNSIAIIDPIRLMILGSIPTGQPESHMLAITSDGRRGFTANVGPGTVSVLDLEAKKVLAVIPVSATVQRITLSVDDRWVFTADQTEPQLAAIDTTTN